MLAIWFTEDTVEDARGLPCIAFMGSECKGSLPGERPCASQHHPPLEENCGFEESHFMKVVAKPEINTNKQSIIVHIATFRTYLEVVKANNTYLEDNGVPYWGML